MFKTLHSIELSKKYYSEAKERLKHADNIHFHFGDSAKVMEYLLPAINEPAVFFLDAHFSGGDTAFGDEETALLRELTLIGKRNYEDIIIIDDANLLGKSGMTRPGRRYPWQIKYDWRNITLDKIKKAVHYGKTRYILEQFGGVIVVCTHQTAIKVARYKIKRKLEKIAKGFLKIK